MAAAADGSWWLAFGSYWSGIKLIQLDAITGKRLAPASVKQHLAAIRMLCDWLVVGQVIATNPAAPVRGSSFVAT